MKKTLRIASLLLAIVMLVSATPVAAIASTLDTKANNYHTELTEDPIITVDGKIDEDYVCATPNGATVNIVDGSFEGWDKGWAPTLSSKELIAVDPDPAVANVANNIVINYYLAQDDDNIYIAITMAMPEATYIIDGVDFSTSKWIITNVRLGFNPDDYTQQIGLVSHGFWATQDNTSAVLGINYKSWTRYPLIVTGLADNNDITIKRGPDTKIITDYVDENGTPKDSVLTWTTQDGVISRTFEMKLNKAAIEAEYDEVFGSNVDFGSMYLGLSGSDYQWANNDDQYGLFFATGSVISADEAVTNGLNTWLPDKIVFGEECPEGGVHTGGTATCTSKKVCFKCGEEYGSPKAHIGGTATCKSRKICSSCGEEYGYLNPDNHENAPTWSTTETTHSAVYKCCQATVANENHHLENGSCFECGYNCEHTTVTDPAVAPTCTKAGLTEGKHCDKCGMVMVKQEKTPALGHNFDDDICTVCGSSLQDVYYAGNSFATEITIDGNIDKDYVCATPDGATVNIVDSSFEGWNGGWAPVLSSTALNVIEPNSVHADVINGLTVNYYLAQDDENVYVAIKISMPETTYEVDGITYRTNKYLMTNVRLGFNPYDYTQQVSFISDGFFTSESGQFGKFGLDKSSITSSGFPLLVTGLADNENVTIKRGVDSGIIANSVTDTMMTRTSADGIISRTYEMKLNKAAIEAEYAEVFGSDVDFDSSMYIGVSASDYDCVAPSWDDVYSLYFATGTVLTADEAEEIGYNTWIPDMVLFEDDPNPVIPEETTEEETTAPEETTEEEETTTPEEETTQPEEETTQPEEETTEAPVTNAPTTEAPTTEPEESQPATEVEPVVTEPATTEAPATEAPKTEAPTTEAPEEEKKGCGSTVGVAGIALITALGTCTVFVAKKKED